MTGRLDEYMYGWMGMGITRNYPIELNIPTLLHIVTVKAISHCTGPAPLTVSVRCEVLNTGRGPAIPIVSVQHM